MLERAPDDPPKPRRSHRTADDDFGLDDIVEVEHTDLVGNLAPSSNVVPHVLPISSPLDTVEGDEHEPKENGKAPKRKRGRLVGGWISPQFSNDVDRSWLQVESPPRHFDLRTHIPQTGDIVLYYPAGHKQFLDVYPDVLGKKTKSITRVPLWEKARAERLDPDSSNSRWWSPLWLDNFDEKYSRFPIICRIRHTHAEFPPDRFTKVIKDGEVIWKKPKPKKMAAEGPSLDRLRLALSLQPLTTLLPPVMDLMTAEDDHHLSLPPIFSVAICPCDLDPFIVPFSWAYASYHSLEVKKDAFHRSDSESPKVRVDSFDRLEDTSGSFRLEDKAGFLANESNGDIPRSEGDKAREYLPAADEDLVRKVFQLFKDFLPDSRSLSRENLMRLVHSTLPLWKGVVVMKSVHDRNVIRVSPWDLSPGPTLDSFVHSALPDPLAVASQSVEPSLRTQFQTKMEEHLRKSPGASVFLYPITDEVAPSYYCAVPVGMCLKTIMNRLGTSDSGSSACFYRSVDSVLMDLQMIADNCILYNSPEADVVRLAFDFVAELKNDFVALGKEHFSSVENMNISDSRNRDLLLRVTGLSSLRLGKWDIRKSRPLSKLSSELGDTWIPQAGDIVSYSSSRYRFFLRQNPVLADHLSNGEFSVSRNETPGPGMSEMSEDDDWISRKILWTRCLFLPESSSATDAPTGPFFCLGLNTGNNSFQNIEPIYWMPDTQPGVVFLKITNNPPETLSLEDRAGLSKCLDFLKSRVLKEKEAAAIDVMLTVKGIEDGFVPPKALAGYRDFAKYFDEEKLGFRNEDIDTGTRGKPKKIGASDTVSLRHLVTSGFVPSWVDPEKGLPDKKKWLKASTLVPQPSLCLETIHSRLQGDFYRHPDAIAIDIVDSYANAVVSLLYDVAKRKKSPLSIRRVVRILSLVKEEPGLSGDSLILNFNGRATKEEIDYALQLRRVRDLHAVFLTAVLDLKSTSCVYGFGGLAYPPVEPPMPEDELLEDPVRAQARLTIRGLMEAITRDPLDNIPDKPPGKDSVPDRRLRVVCNGKVVSGEKIVEVIPYTKAILTNEITRVRVRVGGKLVTREKDISPPTRAHAMFEGKLQKVSFRCDGKVVKGDINAVRARRSRWAPPVSTSTQEFMSFEREDYEGNDDLVKFIFGRPGRMDPCARCLAYRRSLLVCRVLRAHSNTDYDWVQNFGGVGGVDGLLSKLRLGSAAEEGKNQTAEETGEEMEVDEENGIEEGIENEADDPDEDDEEVLQESGEPQNIDKEPSEEDPEEDGELFSPEVDPIEMIEKAQAALVSSQEILEKAKVFAQAPLRLSKSFIEEAIPIDSSDNHFIYCIICGLSGDLLCCDGCANVVHPKCVGLESAPEGDWYCEECETKESKEGEEVQAYQRLEFDDDDARLEEVTNILEDIRSYHPEDRHRRYREKKREEERKAKQEEERLKREQRKPSTAPKVIFKDDMSDFESEEDGDPDSDAEDFVPWGSSGGGSGRRGRRKSIQNPIDVLSAMNRTFLESYGITTAKQLLDARTSDVADAFGEWRKREGLKPLAGTGNVASVSAWKNLCRNAAHDLDNGLYEEKGKAVPRKSPNLTSWSRRSKDVNDPFDVLSDMNREFLATIGITSAESLLESRTAEVGNRFADWRKKEGLPPLVGTGTAASVSMWKNACRKKAIELGKPEIAELSAPSSTRKRKAPQGSTKNRVSSGKRRSQRERIPVIKEPERPSKRMKKGKGRVVSKKNGKRNPPKRPSQSAQPTRSSRRRKLVEEEDERGIKDDLNAQELTKKLLEDQKSESPRPRRKRRRIR